MTKRPKLPVNDDNTEVQLTVEENILRIREIMHERANSYALDHFETQLRLERLEDAVKFLLNFTPVYPHMRPKVGRDVSEES